MTSNLDAGDRCPECNAEVRGHESGMSYIVECLSQCGWSAATTNTNTPGFDEQPYSVHFRSAASPLSVAARAAAVLGRPAASLLRAASGEEALVTNANALEVLHIARLLAGKGIGVAISPDFPWQLPEIGPAP